MLAIGGTPVELGIKKHNTGTRAKLGHVQDPYATTFGLAKAVKIC